MFTTSPAPRIRRPALALLLALFVLLPLVEPLRARPAQAAFVGRFAGGFGPQGQGYAKLPSGSHYFALAYQHGRGYVAGGDREHQLLLTRLTHSGRLDSTFGRDGSALTSIGESARAYDLAVLPDASIVAAGQGQEDFAVARYLPEGELDSSFGGGFVTTNFDRADETGLPAWDSIYGLALQPDGKIVAAGHAGLCDADVCEGGAIGIARYLPEGQPDPVFGEGGKRVTAFVDLNEAYGSAAQTVAIGPDGTIAVAGLSDQGESLAVVRYLPDGQLDPAFAVSGLGAYEGFDTGFDLAILPDGKLLVLSANGRLLRLLPDGNPDPSFNKVGWIATETSAGVFRPRRLDVLPGGQILVAGSIKGGDGHDDLIVARYNPDGRLDRSFGGGEGFRQLDVPALKESHSLSDMLVDPNGYVVLLASVGTESYLLRLRHDGSLDSDAGATFTPLSQGEDEIAALAVPADNSIVAVGTSDQQQQPRIVVARYSAYGDLKRDFGEQGFAVAGAGLARAVAIDAKGSILVAGDATFRERPAIFVRRLPPNGRPAGNTFLDAGLFVTYGRDASRAGALLQQPDGKLLVAGGSATPLLKANGFDLSLARLNADGLRDPSFGAQGYALHHLGGNELVRAATLLADGRILVAGDIWPLGEAERRERVFVARLLSNGALDPAFGAGKGYVIPDLVASAAGLAVQPDGKLLLATTFEKGRVRRIAALRYLPDGEIDISYGERGLAAVDFGIFPPTATDLALDASGAATLVGCSDLGHVLLARLDRQGAIEQTTFGGTTIASFGQGDACAHAAGYHAGLDAVLVGGRQRNASGGYSFGLGSVSGSQRPNSVPQPQGSIYSTAVDTPLILPVPGLLAGVVDLEGDPLGVALFEPTTNGTIGIAPDGSLSYTPNPGFTGQDRFSYTLSDGLAVSRKINAAVNVVPAEDLPPTTPPTTPPGRPGEADEAPASRRIFVPLIAR